MIHNVIETDLIEACPFFKGKKCMYIVNVFYHSWKFQFLIVGTVALRHIRETENVKLTQRLLYTVVTMATEKQSFKDRTIKKLLSGTRYRH